MTEVLFSSENQQNEVEYRRVVSVVIYVIPKEAKPQSVYALLVYGTNNGSLSKRAQENEFKNLTTNEIKKIEKQYKIIFGNE